MDKNLPLMWWMFISRNYQKSISNKRSENYWFYYCKLHIYLLLFLINFIQDIFWFLVIFVRDIEMWLDLKIISFLTTLLYVYLVSSRTQSEVYEITSSTTEIKEIFHNPAGSLLRGPPDDPSGRKIYLKLRSIQSEGRFLALDSAPEKKREEEFPVLLEITQRASVCVVSCASIPRTRNHPHVRSCVDTHAHTRTYRPGISVSHTRGRRVSRDGERRWSRRAREREIERGRKKER